MPVFCENFRSAKQLTIADGDSALRSLPVGEGITRHGVQGIFENGNVIRLCVHLDRMTDENKSRARFLLARNLEAATAGSVRKVDPVAELPSAARTFFQGAEGKPGFLGNLEQTARFLVFGVIAILILSIIPPLLQFKRA